MMISSGESGARSAPRRASRSGSSAARFFFLLLSISLLWASEAAWGQNAAPSLPTPSAGAGEATGNVTEGAPLIYIRWRGQEATAPAVIPAGTRVSVSLKRALSSATARKGETVEFEVAVDVRDPGGRGVLIPKGTPAFGTVTAAQSAGPFGRPGAVRVACDYVLLSGDRRVPLRPAPDLAASGRSRRAASTATMLAVGLPIWGLTHAVTNFFGNNKNGFVGEVVPLGAGILSGFIGSSIWRGGNVSLPAGTTFATEVSQEIPLPTPAPPPTDAPVTPPVEN